MDRRLWIVGLMTAGLMLVAAQIWVGTECKPGDRSFSIGTVMKLAGC